jgi:hypothetical protein
MNQQRRIPTFLALFSLIGLVVALAFGASQIRRNISFKSNADQTVTPRNVGVANVSDSSVTIFWTTDKPTRGAVLYGSTKELGEGIGIDERNSKDLFETHFVRLSNLTPEKFYYFKITSDTSTFGNSENQEAAFEFKTAPKSSVVEPLEPLFGSYISDTGPIEGAIVSWQAAGSSKLVSLTKKDGSFLIPLSLTRNTELDSFLVPQKGTAETMEFLDKNGVAATLTCSFGQGRPLPKVKPGEKKDCLDSSDSQTPVTKARFRPPSVVNTDILTINITDGEILPTALPLFTGTAPGGELLQIKVVGRNQFSGSLKIPSDGRWSWSPPANLSAGNNSITVTIASGDKKNISLTRIFSVPGNDSILGVSTGTPSATLKHFSCVSQTCVEVEGEGQNECTTNTDCKPTEVPPVTPPPTSINPPPTTTPTPVTGAVEDTLFALTWGLLFLTLGAVTASFLISK